MKHLRERSITGRMAALGLALGFGAGLCLNAGAQPDQGEWLEVVTSYDGDAETWTVESPEGYEIIGTDGSWDDNPAVTIEAAFDGDFDTFFDSPGGQAWLGLDLGEGAEYQITGIRYSPRDGFAGRGVGATIQGANQADFSDAVVLLTIEEEQSPGEWTTFNINHEEGFRYVFYEGPDDEHTDIAAIEFYGLAIDSLRASVSGPAIAQAGSTVTLTSIVQNAEGEVSYQWLKDGDELDGATESTLVLADVSAADEGAYALRVTDDEDEVTSTAFNLMVGENVPAAGGVGLGALAAGLAAAGAGVLWRRRRG